jgi:hypothetical protein
MALTAPRIDDIPLSQLIADALQSAAQAKAEAFKAERLYKRVRAETFLTILSARNVAERDAMTDSHEVVKRFEDQWIEAERVNNLARARADGLTYRFEQWRSMEASHRAEMKL